VMLHCDMSQMLSDYGMKFTFIVAGAHKVDGNPFEPLSEDVRADFQTEIDTMYDTFVAAVVRGRGLSEEAVRATEARCYGASDALGEDLVDDIQNPADAVEAYFFPCENNADPDDDDGAGDDEDDDPPEPEESHMAQRPAPTPQARQTPPAQAASSAADTEVTSVDVNQVSADARAAERTRIQGIQGHAEAVGRESLAAHLALETDMSVEAAGKILAASPKAVAAPAADPKQEAQQEQTHFQRAMATGTHPNVGAGAERKDGEGNDDTVTPSNRILANQKRFGVVTPIRDAK
jgi:ClpP class serine protease